MNTMQLCKHRRRWVLDEAYRIYSNQDWFLSATGGYVWSFAGAKIGYHPAMWTTPCQALINKTDRCLHSVEI